MFLGRGPGPPRARCVPAGLHGVFVNASGSWLKALLCLLVHAFTVILLITMVGVVLRILLFSVFPPRPEWLRETDAVGLLLKLLITCLSKSGRQRATKVKEQKLGPVFSEEHVLSLYIPLLLIPSFLKTPVMLTYLETCRNRNTHADLYCSGKNWLISLSQRSCNTVICVLWNILITWFWIIVKVWLGLGRWGWWLL